MNQGQGFSEIFIQAEHRSHGSSHLRDLDGVGQAIAEMIGKPGSENLGFGLEAAESARMDDAVAIALKGVAVGMIGFGIAAAQTLRNGEAESLQHECGAIVPAVRTRR